MSLMLNRCIVRGLSTSARLMGGGNDSGAHHSESSHVTNQGDFKFVKDAKEKEYFKNLTDSTPPIKEEGVLRLVYGDDRSPVYVGKAKDLGYKAKKSYQYICE